MKTKKGAGALDTETLTKPQLRKYHKSICDYYMEHHWRNTLSHFALSPKQASLILKDVRADKANAKVKPKAKKRSVAKVKSSPKVNFTAKRGVQAFTSLGEAFKSLPKGKVTAKPRVVAKALLPNPAAGEASAPVDTLEWLLDYRDRRGHGTDTVDAVIAEFVSSMRRPDERFSWSSRQAPEDKL